MLKEHADEVARVAIIRAMCAAGDVCEEFKHRYPNEEPLIEEIRMRQREAMGILIAVPDVKHSGR